MNSFNPHNQSLPGPERSGNLQGVTWPWESRLSDCSTCLGRQDQPPFSRKWFQIVSNQILALEETCSIGIPGCEPRNLPLKQAPRHGARPADSARRPARTLSPGRAQPPAALPFIRAGRRGAVTAQRKETGLDRRRRLPRRWGLSLKEKHGPNFQKPKKETVGKTHVQDGAVRREPGVVWGGACEGPAQSFPVGGGRG